MEKKFRPLFKILGKKVSRIIIICQNFTLGLFAGISSFEGRVESGFKIYYIRVRVGSSRVTAGRVKTRPMATDDRKTSS